MPTGKVSLLSSSTRNPGDDLTNTTAQHKVTWVILESFPYPPFGHPLPRGKGLGGEGEIITTLTAFVLVAVAKLCTEVPLPWTRRGRRAHKTRRGWFERSRERQIRRGIAADSHHPSWSSVTAVTARHSRGGKFSCNSLQFRDRN